MTIAPLTAKENEMRTASIIAALVLAQSAVADQIVLWGVHQQTNIVTNYVPPPRAAHLNEFVVPEVFPSLEPQFWSWPVTELPDRVDSGIGAVSRNHDVLRSLPVNHRLLEFTPERAELELTYWHYTPVNGAHRIEWRIIGDGTIVPEPSTLMMVWLLSFVGRRRRPK
jgi:hypothetical protein